MDTYNEIYTRMCTAYQDRTGAYPDDSSDIGIRMKVLAGELYGAAVHANWLKNQMFVQTAQGEYLDYHGTLRGITRKEATKSKGYINFYISQPVDYDVVIPKGTIVATSQVTPVRFVTTVTDAILAGQTTAMVSAQAQQAGSSGNVLTGKITVLVNPPAGIERAYNITSFREGTDAETDEELRNRILYSYQNVSNGTNCAYYKNLALSVSGVYSAGVIPVNRGTGTVDVFVSGKGTTVSAAIVKSVQELVSARREINLDVLVKNAASVQVNLLAEITVKKGYYFSSLKTKCISQITNYINGLGIGESVYLSRIGDLIYHMEGVADYKFVSAVSGDVAVTQGQFPVAGNIAVSEMG